VHLSDWLYANILFTNSVNPEKSDFHKYFSQNFHCEWESLKQELEHDNAEGEDVDLIDDFNSLIYILLGCHVPGGSSVIKDVFSLRKVCFVAMITGNAHLPNLNSIDMLAQSVKN
jgi:hypothetical protein